LSYPTLVHASTYKHDNLNRLLCETYDNYDVIQYTYDSAGNLTSTVRINHDDMSAITVSITSTKLTKGKSVRLGVKLVRNNKKTDNITNYATYQSSDTKVASVSPFGVVNATGAGNVDINVTYGNKTEKINLTVADNGGSNSFYKNDGTDVNNSNKDTDNVNNSNANSSNVDSNDINSSSNTANNSNEAETEITSKDSKLPQSIAANSKSSLENEKGKENISNTSSNDSKDKSGNTVTDTNKSKHTEDNVSLDGFKRIAIISGACIVVLIIVGVKLKK
jgi:YD repeat-containing protein